MDMLVGALLMAAAGGLFSLGRLWERHKSRPAVSKARRESEGVSREKWQQMWNFLNYDGSEMPAAHEKKE